MVNKIKQSKGFTLIELLIVIAVMAILMAVVFVALNPLARFEDTRNSRRWTDVNAIISAIKLHQVDNQGILLGNLATATSGDYYLIGTSTSGCDTAITCLSGSGVNIGSSFQASCLSIADLETKGYLAKVPVDPTTANWDIGKTGYYVVKNANGSLTVGACGEEQGSSDVTKEIEVQR